MEQRRLSFREFEHSRLGTLLLMGFHAFSIVFWILVRLLSQRKAEVPAFDLFLIFMGLAAIQFSLCLLRLLRGKTVR